MIKEMIDVMGIANQNNKLVEAYGVEVDEIYKWLIKFILKLYIQSFE